jgi:hypothetical protein
MNSFSVDEDEDILLNDTPTKKKKTVQDYEARDNSIKEEEDNESEYLPLFNLRSKVGLTLRCLFICED